MVTHFFDSGLDFFIRLLVVLCRENQHSVLLLFHTIVEPTQARKDKHTQYKCWASRVACSSQSRDPAQLASAFYTAAMVR